MDRGDGGASGHWQNAILTVVGFLLALLIASTLNQDLLGNGEGLRNWTYFILLGAAIVLVIARIVFIPEQRLAWCFFALGLAAWTAGDIYYLEVLSSRDPIPYPSLSDALYGVLYVSFIAGLWKMGGPIRGTVRISVGLFVCLFGLATLWSWLIYGIVIDTAVGSTSAIATTVTFPALDLILLGSALVAVAARNWHLDRAFAALIFGFSLLAVVDLIYAAQVANGTYRDGSLLELGWVCGALAVALASWLPQGEPGGSLKGNRLLPVATTFGAGIGLTVLFIDHFNPVDTTTFVLATITISLAVIYLFVLFSTAARAREEALASEALRSSSIEAALDAILTIDSGSKVHEWNRAAELTFGYSREEAIGQDFADLIAPPDMRELHREGVAGLEGAADSPLLNRLLETMAMNSRGELFPVEMSVTRLRGEPELFTGFIRDISERKRSEEATNRLAAIVRSSQDAIFSIDLNGIVTAWNPGAEQLYGYSSNEAMGRLVADLTIPAGRIHEMASMIDRTLREGSATMTTQRHTKQGEVLEVSIRAFPMRDMEDRISGISVSAHDITERRRREKEKRADADRQLWKGRIEEALAEDGFEFWGQPVIDAASREVDHHELLIRMRRDGKVIAPDEFLPHAENSGIVNEIDSWAVWHGIEIAASTPVAINLSGRSLSTPGMGTLVGDALEAFSTPPENVRFEITETAAAENIDAARALVEDLGSKGCRVALDDFGTGYGTFSYLRHLPVSELKVDMSFTRDLVNRDINQRVVKSIVHVAATFGMETVAEGVEDEATARVLADMGVDLLQGYHFGRPAPMEPLSVSEK